MNGLQADSFNLHSLLIQRHGLPVAQYYWSGKDRSVYSLVSRTVDFGPTVRHDMRSISKSVTSLLWGIAMAEGKTPPLDSPVLSLYPELQELNGHGRERISFAHLLSMSSGRAWNESGNYGLRNEELGLYWHGSQAAYVLDHRLVEAPGTHFRYNGGATAILANVLARRVGMSLPDYARSRLFGPLGIVDWEWLNDVRGRPLAFSGLRLRPEDLVKIGQMILQHGQWNGRQIVPAAWIDASIAARVDTGDGLQYGFQWWLGKTEAAGRQWQWMAGFGNGGQRLFVVPELDLVIVITAGLCNSDEGAMRVNRLFHQLSGAISTK